MNKHLHIVRLFLLVVAFALSAIPSYAQRPDNRSFEHLWTLYDGINPNYIRDLRSMLDTIAWKAEAEHNSYQLLIANHKQLDISLMHGDIDVLKTLRWLDSLSHRTNDARWGDPDSLVYRALYHYFTGVLLYAITPYKEYGQTIADADFTNIELWSTENFRNASREQFFACLDAMPRNVSLLTHRWDFLITGTGTTRVLHPTLNDVLVQEILDRFGESDTALAITLIDEIMTAHTERNVLINYEIQKLHYRFPKPEEDVDASACWRALESLEQVYGPDLVFDYERGLLLAAADQLTDRETDYKSRALAYFEKVIRQCEDAGNKDPIMRHYAHNARYYTERLTMPNIIPVKAQTNLPLGHKLRIPVQYSNLDTVYLSVFKNNYIVTFVKQDWGREVDYQYFRNSSSFEKNREMLGEPVHTQCFVLGGNGKSRFNTTELWVDSLPIGNYYFFFHLNPTIDSLGMLMETEFRVTRLKVADWEVLEKTYVAVHDVRTGEPLRNMRVKHNNWNSFTNRYGEVQLTRRLFRYGESFLDVYDHKVAHIINSDDFVSSPIVWDYPQGRFNSHSATVQIFTDRTLYRPGQTAHFKILLSQKGKPKCNVPVEVCLEGKNISTPDTLRLVTSEYGTVCGEFKLPQTVGKYYIRFHYPKQEGYSNYYKCLEVAEYKLPTFKVKLLPDTLQAASGDTLTIRGKVTTLNGLPVGNAAVSLYIKGGGLDEHQEVFTERDGRFEYPCAVPRASLEVRINIEAIVTDVNGETHRDKTSVVLPPKLLTVNILGSREIDQATVDTAVWVLQAVNFNNISQPVPLRVAVVRLQPPAEYKIPVFKTKPTFWMPLHSKEEYAREFPHLTFEQRPNDPANWPVTDTLFRNKALFLPDSLLQINIKNWLPGNYKIIVNATDKSGKPVETAQHFTVYSSGSTEYKPLKTIHLDIISMPEKAGKPFTLSVGSCLRNAVMVCDVYQGDEHLKTMRIPLDREQKTLTVKPRANGHRGINILARIVQNGELHTATLDTLAPMNVKKAMQYARAFDKLLLNAELTHWHTESEPGASEHWEITLTDGGGKAVRDAELLAWMIDGSLYELDMEKPLHFFGSFRYGGRWKKIPRALHTYRNKIICNDLSIGYSDYSRYRNYTIEKSVLKYERATLGFSSQLYSETDYEDPDMVIIQYEPPVFSMDNTANHFLLSGDNIRTVHGRSVTDALADNAGVSSVDGTMTSVRGNRSDGQQTIVDGMRVRDTEPRMNVTTAKDILPAAESSLSPDMTPRSNFVETAFFYPNLQPDDSGRVRINFTLPDQYTSWEFYAMAHRKNMWQYNLTASLQSRRTLMLQSNAPRFLREGDTLTLRAKVTNRSDQRMNGTVAIEFWNAENNEPIDLIIDANSDKNVTSGSPIVGTRHFNVEAGGSQMVQFRIIVPSNIPAVHYWMTAHSDNYTDGEMRILPVLPNKMLVTETRPFVVPANTDTALTFSRYRTHNTPTMQPLSYTVEVTTNPAWLAIRSLPYLMRYPYDCNEQTFSKLFAAATVKHAIAMNPGLDTVFRSWLNDTVNDALASPLLKNESLHTLLLEETPWLRDAQSESRQRKETAELFAAENLNRQIERSLKKLIHNQLPGGGWDWYGCYGYSRYITDHLIAGFYKLQRMGVEIPQADKMLKKAIRKSDQEHEADYQRYLKQLEKHPETQFFFSEEDVHYLYARSFAPYDSVWLSQPYVQNLMNRMTEKLPKASLTRQAEVALILYRAGDPYDKHEARQTMEYIRQQAVVDRELGMYWRDGNSCRYYRWYEAPIERQALLIEAFTEIAPREDDLTKMKQWLLMQKKGNAWSSTKATAEAVYALLLNAPADLLKPAATVVTVAGEAITNTEAAHAEAGTGYLQRVWKQEAMTPTLADITVRTDGTHPTFGAAYWQYLEVPDKVEAAGSGLSVKRTLYHQPTGGGAAAEPVTDANPVRLGERITVKIAITSDRELEYVQVKDPRASAFEPVNIHERNGWQQGVRWVESPREASNCFFFSTFPKGTIVLEYDVFATQTGDFSAGATSVECMYAPEWRAQGSGTRIRVHDK